MGHRMVPIVYAVASVDRRRTGMKPTQCAMRVNPNTGMLEGLEPDPNAKVKWSIALTDVTDIRLGEHEGETTIVMKSVAR